MRLFALAAILALLAIPAQAGTCLQYDTNAEFGRPSGNLNTYRFCDCVMYRIRGSEILNNEQKSGLAEGYSENAYKIAGVNVEAVRAGRAQITETQRAQVNEILGILDDCSPKNNEE